MQFIGVNILRRAVLITAFLFSCYGITPFTANAVNKQQGNPPDNERISIIPAPMSIHRSGGYFILPRNIRISCNQSVKEMDFCARYLKNRISKATGYSVSISPNAPQSNISFKLIDKDSVLQQEGYRLFVSKNGTVITANSPAGIFYGIQTLLQLFPPEIESRTLVKLEWKIPLVDIVDRPKVGWRGLMLDVARHFFGKQEIKSFVDNMVRYKFNLLHLHLTDDEGWRIEIKSLPMLTKTGAWRANKVGTFGFFPPPAPDEPRTYGGFLTQDDMHEIIQYAKERFVDILPEIDMPGHSLAAIASYPNLSSTGIQYPVNSGEKVMEWPAHADFYALVDNSLCAAKPEVYEFADKVLTEIAQLFPFGYIHIGGDENAKNFWAKSDLIAELMKSENLKDLHEVEEYFIKKIEKIVRRKGKKMIGWDEIATADLDTSTAVMNYRSIDKGIAASKKGHQIIVDDQMKTYLNYQQGDSAIEPPVHSTLLLEAAYSFDPFEGGMDPESVKGVEGNLWTEQVYTERHLQYMIWPRAFAVAEAGWSLQSNKNWPGFISRVEDHLQRLDAAQIKYSPALYDVILKPVWENDSLKLEIQTQIPGVEAHYSFDNSYPDNFYPSWKGKLTVPSEASCLRVVTCRKGKVIGRMTTITVNDLKKRAVHTP